MRSKKDHLKAGDSVRYRTLPDKGAGIVSHVQADGPRCGCLSVSWGDMAEPELFTRERAAVELERLPARLLTDVEVIRATAEPAEAESTMPTVGELRGVRELTPVPVPTDLPDIGVGFFMNVAFAIAAHVERSLIGYYPALAAEAEDRDRMIILHQRVVDTTMHALVSAFAVCSTVALNRVEKMQRTPPAPPAASSTQVN